MLPGVSHPQLQGYRSPLSQTLHPPAPGLPVQSLMPGCWGEACPPGQEGSQRSGGLGPCRRMSLDIPVGRQTVSGKARSELTGGRGGLPEEVTLGGWGGNTQAEGGGGRHSGVQRQGPGGSWSTREVRGAWGEVVGWVGGLPGPAGSTAASVGTRGGLLPAGGSPPSGRGGKGRTPYFGARPAGAGIAPALGLPPQALPPAASADLTPAAYGAGARLKVTLQTAACATAFPQDELCLRFSREPDPQCL